MKRSAIAAVGLSLGVLAGCGQTSEPSPPPTSEAALSTPSDDSEVTSEAPTTEAVTEEPEADGPPEMPEEAMEQTEAGAEAFALHYIDLINYTGMYPETGLLEPLAADGCESCENHEESVAYGVEVGDRLKKPTFVPDAGDTLLTGKSARVSIPIEQPAQSYFNGDEEIDRKLAAADATLVFRLSWDDSWKITEITISET